MIEFLLNDFIVEEHVKSALKEDIVFGDISTDYLYEEKDNFTVFLRTREDGILCGCSPFRIVFEILGKGKVDVEFYFKDGDRIKKGDKIAKIKGSARAILTGERLALNYMQRMSAIATLTNEYVQAIRGTAAKISDTRKNTPNFRLFEKYAFLTGGGTLHRFSLCDCVMLKDNHIALCGSSIKKAVGKIKERLSHVHKVEVECDTIEQVKECLEADVDIIMLDNMTPEKIFECVEMVKNVSPKIIIEASGGIKLENVRDYAALGIDIISTSAPVSASTMDLGFDYI
jgi:nicotinate-nucleotide pyrophosphorylase (carboxylating)